MSSDDKPSSETPGEIPESTRRLSLPPELLEAIPKENRDEVLHKLGQYFLEVRREEHYSGPLQPFREAAGWNDLVNESRRSQSGALSTATHGNELHTNRTQPKDDA